MLVNPLHQIEIQREPNIFARLTGVFLNTRDRPHDATQGIDLEISHASGAPGVAPHARRSTPTWPIKQAWLVLRKARLAEFFSRDLVDVAQGRETRRFPAT